MNCDKNSLLLYAVTDRAWLQVGETLLGRVRDAIEGGATFVQLREKDLDHAAFLAEGREIGALCREMGVLVSLTEVFAKGGEGGKDLAEKVCATIAEKPSDYYPLYDTALSIPEKLETIAREI